MTSFKATGSKATTSRADILVVLADPDGPLLVSDEVVERAGVVQITNAVEAVALSGPIKSATAIPAPEGIGATTVLVSPVVGERSGEAVRRAVGAALAGTRGQSVAVAWTGEHDELRPQVEGAVLGSYRYAQHRRDTAGLETTGPDRVELLLGHRLTKVVTTTVKHAISLAEAVNIARDLVNEPPNKLFPQALADAAKEILKDTPVTVKVMTEAALKRGGYGGLTAVGQGSANGPRLIQLTYAPKGAETKIALVGKGITFDSGGLSLKPPKSMEKMKSDMGGSAAVLATMRAIADQELPIAVTGWLCSAENMPDGMAQRPGDVITIRGGKSVEVLNTDAEGRLVLADGLVRAQEDNPDEIIDVATLTGAQLVALGSQVAGVMGNNDALRTDVVRASEDSGESSWPMPLPKELLKSLDSNIADMANIGDRNGGMLTAGLFLQEFVEDDVPWVHLDIAGPSFNESQPYGYTPKGGTGFAVRTLTEYLANRSEA